MQFFPDPYDEDRVTQVECWRNPVFALSVDVEDWVVHSRWDDKAITCLPDESPVYRGTEKYLTPLGSAVDSWTDFVVHVKFDWVEDGDGILQVWKNGSLWIDQTGPNCYHDWRGPWCSFGIYKWPWAGDYDTNSTERLVYHDALKIAGADGSYSLVAPA